MLSVNKKEAVSPLQKDFPTCVDPVQHQYVFSKGLLGEFVNSSPLRSKYTCSFGTEI